MFAIHPPRALQPEPAERPALNLFCRLFLFLERTHLQAHDHGDEGGDGIVVPEERRL